MVGQSKSRLITLDESLHLEKILIQRTVKKYIIWFKMQKLCHLAKIKEVQSLRAFILT